MNTNLLAAALCGLMGAIATGQPVSLESLLTEMTDRGVIASFPSPAYTCKQFSSYDRASTSADDLKTWFANGDQAQYLRIEKNPARDNREERVMMDIDGPGAIVRIWSPDPKGTLCIYIDGESEPLIEAPMLDLLAGKATIGGVAIGEPLAATRSLGWNLYLPIPYAKHCKVTCTGERFYYQVNYRTYATGAKVESLTAKTLGKSPIEIVTANAELKDPNRVSASIGQPTTVAPGATQTLEFPAGNTPGMAITALGVSLRADQMEQALRSTVISASFDGEQTIWAPIGDFFGSGVGVNAFSDHYRSVKAPGEFNSWFVMPFREKATITVTNLGSVPIKLAMGAKVDVRRWDERSMHFHAGWRHEFPIAAKGGVGTKDWNYLEATGKGVYVGDSLAVMNPVEAWWGEGDEKVYVDGEKFPSHFGTGTEDYYGYGWCCPRPFNMPFISQPRVDGNGRNNYGQTSVTRVRSLDAIPFTKSFKFDMEVWHWAACEVSYSATTYWYATPGATTNRTPDEKSAKAPVPQAPPLPPPFAIAGAIECETMQVSAKSAGMAAEGQDMIGFGKGKWSNETHLWCRGTAVGDFVELSIPAPAGKHKVTLYATKSWDYATVKFTVNGSPAGPDGKPIDLYSGGEGKVLATGPIELGTFSSVNGVIKLRAEITGANAAAKAPKTFFGLDAVKLGQ